MAQVKGRLRLLTTRFSSERVGRVKYSMLCPSRIDSPWAASRAMPMSLGLSNSGSRGRVAMIRFLFAYDRTIENWMSSAVRGENTTGGNMHPTRGCGQHFRKHKSEIDGRRCGHCMELDRATLNWDRNALGASHL